MTEFLASVAMRYGKSYFKITVVDGKTDLPPKLRVIYSQAHHP
jgi:hypothetical protein